MTAPITGWYRVTLGAPRLQPACERQNMYRHWMMMSALIALCWSLFSRFGWSCRPGSPEEQSEFLRRPS
jgi:hypothetical protein